MFVSSLSKYKWHLKKARFLTVALLCRVAIVDASFSSKAFNDSCVRTKQGKNDLGSQHQTLYICLSRAYLAN